MIKTRRIPQDSRTEKSPDATSRTGARVLTGGRTSATAHALAGAAAHTRTSVPARGLAVMLALVLTAALALLPVTPAFAANAEEIVVTGYSIAKGSTAHYTGSLNKGDRVTITLNVSDTRPFLSAFTPGNPPAPEARLNTSSFTIANQSDIRVGNPTPFGTGGWNYTVTFSNLTYTGAGQDFHADILYPAADGAPLFAYNQTISQCVPWTEPPSEPAPEPPAAPTATVKGTGFIIESYDTGSETIYAGKPFTLNLSWLATNGSSTLENVTVGLTPSQEITLAKGTNLVYVGTVKPGAKIPISYELLPGAATNEGSYTVAIDIKGIDATSGSEIAAQASVTMPVLQQERFSILKSTLPTELALGASGDAGYGSVTLINQGRTSASNVFVDVVGKGLELKEGKQYIGTINGGEQKTADLNFTASGPGTVKAKVVVTYENARGEAKEITKDFTVNVQEAKAEPTLSLEELEGADNEAKAGFPWWVVALIALAAVTALIVGLTVWKKKRKAAQQEKLLADDWGDEYEEEDDAGALGVGDADVDADVFGMSDESVGAPGMGDTGLDRDAGMGVLSTGGTTLSHSAYPGRDEYEDD